MKYKYTVDAGEVINGLFGSLIIVAGVVLWFAGIYLGLSATWGVRTADMTLALRFTGVPYLILGSLLFFVGEKVTRLV